MVEKVTSNEQKVRSNEQKLTSNEQKVMRNEQRATRVVIINNLAFLLQTPESSLGYRH